MSDEVVQLFPKVLKNQAAPAEPPPAAEFPPDRELIELLEHYLAQAKRGSLRGIAVGLLWRDGPGGIAGSIRWAGEANKERFTTAGLIRALDHRFATKMLG